MQRENPLQVFGSIVLGLVIGVAVFVGGYIGIQQFRIFCAPACQGRNFSRLSLYRPFPEGQPESRGYILSLDGTDFTGSDLAFADFRGISMRDAIFDEAELTAVNFADSDLAGATFAEATLERARLQRADLRNTDFSEADLSNAILTGASLQGADFTAADLFGVTLDGATFDQATTWPDGFDPEAAGAVPLGGPDL